jgi:hypothetical protein
VIRRAVVAVVVAAAAFGFGAIAATATMSSSVSATEQVGTAQLSAPSGLSAVCTPLEDITLTWTASPSPAAGYAVFREAIALSTWTEIGTTTGGSATSFTDTNVNDLAIFQYEVEAADGQWLSAASTPASTGFLC